MKGLTLTMLTLMVVKVVTVSSTHLDDYVNAKDEHYNYTFLKSYRAHGATLHVVNMTSQKWMDETLTDRFIWWHYLTIVIPDNLNQTGIGSLYISSGHNTNRIPSLRDQAIREKYKLAVNLRTVLAILQQIPNNPMVFKNEPSKMVRQPDAQIAWTWKMFFENQSNPEVVLYLPMTKAVVRAMDTVSSYCQQILNIQINKFLIAGASKRGWVTWLTAAVDKRVIGFSPIVMDLLNIREVLHQQFRSLGGWSFAFKPYYDCNLTKIIDTDNFTQLTHFIDPFSYIDRYRHIPKYIITATGDEFFLPDDSRYYWSYLKGPTYLSIVPAVDHLMVGQHFKLLHWITSFYSHIVRQAPLPSIRWKKSQSFKKGKIIVWTDREPKSICMYSSHTIDDSMRDFRVLRKSPTSGIVLPHKVIWSKGEVKNISRTQFEAEMEMPSKGWTAFYIQMTFHGIGETVFHSSTEIHIIPDTYPFQDCKGTQCYGTLL